MFRCIEDFDILHGDLQGLSDTMTFLKSLAELDSAYESEKATEKRQMRERKAAAGLFNWEVSFISTKAHRFYHSHNSIRKCLQRMQRTQ